MPEVSEISKFALRDLINLFYCGNLHKFKSLHTNHPLKNDLKLIAKVSNLIFRKPTVNIYRFIDDLKLGCWHASRWVFNSTQPIHGFDATVTYALVKEKLRSFMASAAFIELTWQEPVYYQNLPVVPSLLDHLEQQSLQHTSDLLVVLNNVARNAIPGHCIFFEEFFFPFEPCESDYIQKVSNLIFRRSSRKPYSRSLNTLSTCFEYGQLLVSRCLYI